MKKIAWMGLLFVMTIGLIFTLMGQSGSYCDFSDIERSQENIFQAGTWKNPDTVPPVITLIGDEAVNLTVDDSYTDAGATASDDVDGDITANIVVGGDTVDTSTVGTYIITYNVSDAAGNPATKVTRTVIVSEEEPDPDTVPPVITLIGDEAVNLTVDDSYTDAGATASDDVDGDITANIVVVNLVNTSVVGTYTITYDVSDAVGNPADQVTRTVIVSEELEET